MSTFFQPAIMGIQSQLREGSIKACKKRATRQAKHKRKSLTQMGVDGGRAFLPERDCAVCRAKHLNLPVPHRAHDKRCPHNRSTRGGSKRSVEVEKIAAEHIRQNNIPPVAIPVDVAMNNASDLRSHFTPNFQQPKAARAASNPKPPPAQTAPQPVTEEGAIPTAQEIREELRERFHKKRDAFSWAFEPNYKPPAAVALSIDFVISKFKHRRREQNSGELSITPKAQAALDMFRKLFPVGTCEYQFPPIDPTEPMQADPTYHSVQGQSLFYVDWGLLCPAVTIPCLECKIRGESDVPTLRRERTNFGRNKRLFPLWRAHSGTPSWCVIVTYKCPLCDATMNSNEGRVLQVLPAWLRQQYPVEPRYATGSFHLDKANTRILETMMVTSSSASVFSKMLYQKYNDSYVDKVENYLSLPVVAENYVDLPSFQGNTFTPSAEAIRELFLEAEQSFLTPYGYSNESRFVRELQAVTLDDFDDWMFQVLKNYYGINCTGQKPSLRVLRARPRKYSRCSSCFACCRAINGANSGSFFKSLMYLSDCDAITGPK